MCSLFIKELSPLQVLESFWLGGDSIVHTSDAFQSSLLSSLLLSSKGAQEKDLRFIVFARVFV